ncbi:MAG: hypothetical protein R3E42_13915 [Burkholderiaceae bacterium]
MPIDPTLHGADQQKHEISKFTFDQACTELREIFAALVGCIHDHIDSLNQEAAEQLDALFLTRSEPLLRLLLRTQNGE